MAKASSVIKWYYICAIQHLIMPSRLVCDAASVPPIPTHPDPV